MQSSVQWVPTSLRNLTSVLAAGSAPTRTRRVRWSASPALRDPPQPTCTPAASLNAKVRSVSCSCPACLGLTQSDTVPGQCKPGTHSPNGLEICESCPMGHYQPSYAARDCLSCPEETSTVTRGAVDEAECGGDAVYPSPKALLTCLRSSNHFEPLSAAR